ncbi:MAG TPA: hypothetical protein PLP95_07140 [Microthrixaceae bacterium]|nr:hypothetical protein [Microthrixaceae bacterium]
MKSKKLLVIGAGALAAAAVSGCVQEPIAVPDFTRVSCGSLGGGVEFTPAVTEEVQAVQAAATEWTGSTDCDDETGSELTSLSMEGLAIEFPEMGCTTGAGTGTATLRWSDESTSEVSLVVNLDKLSSGTASGNALVVVNTGRFTSWATVTPDAPDSSLSTPSAPNGGGALKRYSHTGRPASAMAAARMRT